MCGCVCGCVWERGRRGGETGGGHEDTKTRTESMESEMRPGWSVCIYIFLYIYLPVKSSARKGKEQGAASTRRDAIAADWNMVQPTNGPAR